MKKLLSLLGAISITGAGISSVVACDNSVPDLTGQHKVDQIRAAIKDTDLSMPYGTDPSIDKQIVQDAITAELILKNPGVDSLIDQYKATLSYTGGNLFTIGSTFLTCTIRVGKASTSIDLSVTLNNQNQQIAEDIKVKIIKTKLTVPADTKTDVEEARTAINTALKSANNTLTDNDLTYITYRGGPLQPAKNVGVVAVITVGKESDNPGIATINLSVTLKAS